MRKTVISLLIIVINIILVITLFPAREKETEKRVPPHTRQRMERPEPPARERPDIRRRQMQRQEQLKSPRPSTREIPPLIEVDESDLLIQQGYYRKLYEELPQAESSIRVIMFLIMFSHHESSLPGRLVRELVNAQERGVEVTVILSDYFEEPNKRPAEFLANNNVRIYMTDERTISHNKMVMIDDEIVYIGSHNWTNMSFITNHESSVRVKSREFALPLIIDFNRILRACKRIAPTYPQDKDAE